MLAGHNDRYPNGQVWHTPRSPVPFRLADSRDISASTGLHDSSAHNAVRQNHWHWHKLRRIIAGVTNHDSLIPGTAGKSALNRKQSLPFVLWISPLPRRYPDSFVDEGIHVDFLCFIACTLQHLLMISNTCGSNRLVISPATMMFPFGRQHLAGHSWNFRPLSDTRPECCLRSGRRAYPDVLLLRILLYKIVS